MNSTCFKCKNAFSCGMLSGAAPCWCAEIPAGAIDATKPSCLCRNCLEERVGQRHWRLWIAYDGTDFAGYQFQPGQKTIQQSLQDAFKELTGLEVALTVAGRTDSGVHARGQAISCSLPVRFEQRRLLLALNHLLPKAISVWRADEMPFGFDAKKHAVGKRYLYKILNSASRDPFVQPYVWHVKQNLDLKAMQEAAAYLVGHHDFESFRSAYCQASHARRDLWKVDVSKSGDLILLDVRGNAFCHNQVRIIAGTLVDVGMARFQPGDVKKMLEAKDRTTAGRTAPPNGLTMEQVYYPDDLRDADIPETMVFPRYPASKESWPFN